MARYPRYAPEFSIRINGERIPAALRGVISSINYTNAMEGADRVEVAIANPGLRWLDHPLLATDNGLRLSMGYLPDALEEVFVGEITGIEPVFPSGGMPTIRVVAQDFLHRTTVGTKDRAFAISIPSYTNIPLPDVAVTSLVSVLNALVPLPDPVGGSLSVVLTLVAAFAYPDVAQKAVRKQSGTSDFTFLTNIARENGWEMYIDHSLDPRGRVLRFQFLIQDYSPSLTLRWGSSLMDFTPRLTTVGDVFGVSARVWVDNLQTEFVIVVSWDYDRAAFNLVVYPSLVGGLGSVLGEEAAKSTISIAPTGYAKAPYEILSELLPRLNNRLTCTGSAIGDARIRAGKVVEFQGLGEQFSGLYRITSVTHSFDGNGAGSKFEGRKEVWFGSIPTPKSASGLLRVNGQGVG